MNKPDKSCYVNSPTFEELCEHIVKACKACSNAQEVRIDDIKVDREKLRHAVHIPQISTIRWDAWVK